MTIARRNIFLLISTAGLLLITVFTISVPFMVERRIGIPFSVILYSPDFFMPVILLLFSVVSLYVIRFTFLKTNSSEIFFYSLFLISLVFDLSRSYIAVFSYFRIPEYYNIYISRVCYFGKFFGLSSLFLAAFFTSDAETKKTETAAAIIILTAYMLASSIPFSTYKLATMIQQPGYFSYFAFAVISIEVLTVLIFILNYFQSGNREYLALSMSMILIFTGRETTFFISEPYIFATGLALLASGTVLFSNKVHQIYSWY